MAKRRDRLRRFPYNPLSRVAPPSNDGDPALVSIDLLRAELYRLLDDLARARDQRHVRLVEEFERTWEIYKLVTAAPR